MHTLSRRHGLAAPHADRIIAGQGKPEDMERLVGVANKIEGHTICALGDAAAWPVQSFIKHFGHEFEYMIEERRPLDCRCGEGGG